MQWHNTFPPLWIKLDVYGLSCMGLTQINHQLAFDLVIIILRIWRNLYSKECMITFLECYPLPSFSWMDFTFHLHECKDGKYFFFKEINWWLCNISPLFRALERLTETFQPPFSHHRVIHQYQKSNLERAVWNTNLKFVHNHLASRCGWG